MRNNKIDNIRGKGQVRGSHRGEFKDNERKSGERQKNPIDSNTEEILRCNICGSIFHIIRKRFVMP